MIIKESDDNKNRLLFPTLFPMVFLTITMIINKYTCPLVVNMLFLSNGQISGYNEWRITYGR